VNWLQDELADRDYSAQNASAARDCFKQIAFSFFGLNEQAVGGDVDFIIGNVVWVHKISFCPNPYAMGVPTQKTKL
jgi:hypothetical protein